LRRGCRSYQRETAPDIEENDDSGMFYKSTISCPRP
jgi:hypothetical protein